MAESINLTREQAARYGDLIRASALKDVFAITETTHGTLVVTEPPWGIGGCGSGEKIFWRLVGDIAAGRRSETHDFFRLDAINRPIADRLVSS